MSEVQSAAMMLAGTTLVFVLIAFLVWRWRSNAGVSRTPQLAGGPSAWRFPRFARSERTVEVQVAMDPARLARIGGGTPADLMIDIAADDEADELSVDERPEPPLPPSEDEDAAGSAKLETMAAPEERDVDSIDDQNRQLIAMRLVPKIAPRADEVATSWLGGRPCLDPGADWPEIRDIPALFLGQIDCADLPGDLWDGLGPRTGALAFFIHPRDGDLAIVQIDEPGEPVDPPHPQAKGSNIFAPFGMQEAGDLIPFARPAFPAWPIELVAVGAGDPDPYQPEHAIDQPGDSFDVADPAFHPFNWDIMLAMVAILAMRIESLDADDPINRDALDRAKEIIAIVRDSAKRDPFSAEAAAAVMDALQQIRWVGAESATLPLTEHDRQAPLWAHDYRAIWFDHAKHAYAADPSQLSPAARTQFETEARALASRAIASIGNIPHAYVAGYDAETHVTLLELPSSGLFGWAFGVHGPLTLTIRKADLAAGRWDRPHAQLGN